jgi:tetratricopeptide (TPR) repeat protein/predicted Ser/Thr protein kinase
MQECLDDNTMAAYVDGVLTADEITRIDSHLSDCQTCRQDLSAMAVTHSEPAGRTHDDDEILPGDTIGRYVLSAEHARGGMGIVSIAFDPELGRNVAIKVLRPELSAQLLRDEARAMAKLNHPNVVTVYDVGEHRGRIYFAMELVEGTTLRRWLAYERHGWRSILRACIHAGRGLAAAHRVGLVHRDFKPDNVLCGPQDRVRVTDFGLASNVPGQGRLGEGSGFAGTPAYIAPEVWRGERATARSDQWSFCSTLYEALFGTPPFTGETREEVRAAIEAGKLEVPARVPGRVRRAIARGLSSDPAARFATLDDLLDELERARRGRRPLWLALGAVGLVAIGAGAYAMKPERDPCEMPRSLIADAWNGTHAQTIATAFAASGRMHASDTAQRVKGIFDRHSSQWLDARRDACVATRVRGDQSEALLDARIRCLDRRRSELAELVRVLGDKPTPGMVDRAIKAAHEELDQVASCSAAGVQAEMPLPSDPVRAKQITALEHEVAKLRAGLTLVTQTEAATQQALSLVERARPLAFPPLSARAAVALARLGMFSTDHAETERRLYDALVATAAAKDDRATAEVWTYLVSFTANTKGDVAGALQLIKPAEAALARVEASQNLRAQLHHSHAIVLTMSGKFDLARTALEQARAAATDPIHRAAIDAVQCHVEQRLAEMKKAQELCTRAVAAYERELGPHHAELAFTLNANALIAFELQDNRAARAGFERGIAILENTVGEKHVAYAMAINNLGMIDAREGKHDAARKNYERAIASFETLKHPELISALANLGDMERSLGRYAESRRILERALEAATAAYGADSPRVAQVLYSLGSVAFDLDDLDAAHAHYLRSLAIAAKTFGENHPITALALDGMGFVYSARDNCKMAVTYQRRAVAAYEAVYGKDYPAVADTLTTLASCQLELGDRQAIANLERALAIRAALPTDNDFQAAGTRWTLAKALAKLGGDRMRAVVLAKEARALYDKSPDPIAKKAVLVEIDRWLARAPAASRR